MLDQRCCAAEYFVTNGTKMTIARYEDASLSTSMTVEKPAKSASSGEQDSGTMNGAVPESSRPTVSLVIPAMNEAKNIAWVLLGIPDYVDEVVLVDGNSTDETCSVARSIRPEIIFVEDPGGGKGAALRAGFERSSSDYIVMMDADGSMDPGEIERYVAMLDCGFELVKGSRFMTGAGSTDITFLRNFGNASLLLLTNRLFGVRLTDLCYGFCAFRRDRLDDMHLGTDGFEIETEITVQALNSRLRVCEVPSMEAPRGHGVSNLNTFRDGLRVLRLIIAGWLTPGRKRRGDRAKTQPTETVHRVIDLTATSKP
jgi:hypothetical protein